MKRKTRNIIIGLAALVLVSGVLLMLDLSNRGLIWQFAWNVTGEEEPVGQMRGLIEYVVTLTRPQPQAKPMQPIAHTNVNPYGINTFLQQEADPNKVEEQLRMVSEAGFTWIRQQFEWAEIEVDGRGQFTDSRNDMDGDGVNDTISAWNKYDRIVDLAEQYDMQIQARLDNPPDWAISDSSIGSFAPPDDLQDFVNFAVAVAERYQGRIRVYQVWNEPNIYPEWGNQPVDPEAYTELLCRTYDALKAVDPDIIVMTGALAATIELNNLNVFGGTNLQDFVFLQRMYDAGAGDCFDVLSIQAYGLWSGPTDRRMRPTTVNIARNQYIRDLMVANGDAHKPIWISEAAWNAVPSESQHPEPIDARYNFGQVTLQQQADYAPQFYQRAQEEWPWIGVVNYWFFTLPNDLNSNQSYYYFRMAEPDYSDEKPTFTPLPVYGTMMDYITSQTPTLYRGVHQAADHWAVHAGDAAQTVSVDGSQYDDVLQTSQLTFIAHGTDISVRWQGDTTPQLTIDSGSAQALYSTTTDGWQKTRITDDLSPQTHTITITSATPILVDSIIVEGRTFEKVFPVVAFVSISMGLVLLAIIHGLLQRRQSR